MTDKASHVHSKGINQIRAYNEPGQEKTQGGGHTEVKTPQGAGLAITIVLSLIYVNFRNSGQL